MSKAIACPLCQAELKYKGKVPTRKTARCPKCRGVVTIPVLEPVEERLSGTVRQRVELEEVGPPRTVVSHSPHIYLDPAHSFLLPPKAAGEIGWLGSYRIVAELGRGGMGLVFQAEDPHLKRQVALKVMLTKEAEDPTARPRFLREARAQARVEHDHIIAIYQVGEDRGVPYLTMPLLKGRTLAAMLRQHPRPPVSEVLRIGREIAEGLAAAHAAQLVHRDIKPANIWLEGNRRRVKILDFGLARAVVETEDDDGSGSGHVTSVGLMVGTPAYMSPEQARGEEVDARTDLFSLGVVLYQMATGELPFRGLCASAILTALAVDSPSAPIDRNPELPPALNDLILHLLEKYPADRPASAHLVGQEIRRIKDALKRAPNAAEVSAVNDPWAEIDAAEQEIGVKPPSSSAVAKKPDHRSWSAVWAGLAGLVLLGMGFMVWKGIQLANPEGTLLVECDDPGIEVVIRKHGKVVVDKSRDRRLVLPASHDYTIELADPKSAFKLSDRSFAIATNTAARVSIVSKSAVAVKEALLPSMAGEERDFEIANGVKMRFCWVPPGKAMLGSPASELDRDPAEEEHEFTAPGFWLGKYEATQGEWAAVMGSNPSWFDGMRENAAEGMDTSRFPVERVSWHDCHTFLEKLNERGGAAKVFAVAGRFVLPHEDEWEYACRGGKGNVHPYSLADELTAARANFGGAADGTGLRRSTKVGSYETDLPHPWGLCDMHGNVGEWCENKLDPSKDGRVIRGGSWNSDVKYCRSASRDTRAPGFWKNYLGLRVAFRPGLGGG